MAKTKSESTTPAKAKTECPITREQFKGAPPAVVIEKVALLRKEFSTGTLGYFAQIEATIEINGIPVKMKGNAQVYIANSKEAK